jgi:hypothetical protein
MNYSINHDLLKDEYILTLKGSKQTASWVALCFIVHWTKERGYADFHSTAFANSWNWKPSTVKDALEGLVGAGLIKCTREYSRKGNIPRRYVAKRYVPRGKKVYPQGSKGIAPGANNNNDNYYNTGKSLSNDAPSLISPPEMKQNTQDTLYWETILKQHTKK